MTLVMIILICVGCALIIAGLAVLAYRAIKLVRAARDVGLSSMRQIGGVVRRGQELAPRMEQVVTKQRAVAERLQRLSATVSDLNYLKDQLDQATGGLSKLKS
jgi:hypothetical protein